MAVILIIGASRGIGLETVKAGLAAGHDVRALARSANAIAITHPHLTKIAGDATDAATLTGALKGCDAVLQTLGSPGLFPTTPVTLFSRATRHLLPAMREAGVRRLIAVTGLGAGDSRGVGNPLYTKLMFPLLLSRIYEDKDVQEKYIRDSGLDWTIVRPGILTHGAATGHYRVLTDPATWTTGTISRADVARFLIQQVGDRSLLHQTPVLIR